MNLARFRKGGTGVAPVKSGVAPDFGDPLSLSLIHANQSVVRSRYGSGRDARNYRRDACST
jgi:hypothetical protein